MTSWGRPYLELEDLGNNLLIQWIFNKTSASARVEPRYNKSLCNRASDRSWKKKSNFAGFLGKNSQKNWQISWEFLGQTSPKSNR